MNELLDSYFYLTEKLKEMNLIDKFIPEFDFFLCEIMAIFCMKKDMINLTKAWEIKKQFIDLHDAYKMKLVIG